MLDSGCAQPLLFMKARDQHPSVSSPFSRKMLLVAASASTGVLFSPAVPIVSSIVGDPKAKGYGPLAVAGLAAVHFASHASVLVVLPSDTLASPAVPPLAAIWGGGVAAVAGVAAAHFAGRE